MEIERAREILFEASRLRVPKFRHQREGDLPPHSQQEKVHLLECYSVDAARWRSFLEEARLYVDEAVQRLSLDWRALEGWEENLPEGKKLKDATKEVITEAKRKTNDDLWRSLENGRHLVKQLSGQIRRIEKDEERVSRLYTFITGGA